MLVVLWKTEDAMRKSTFFAALTAAPLIVSLSGCLEDKTPPVLQNLMMIRIETVPMPADEDIRFRVMPVKPVDRRIITEAGKVIVEQLPLKCKR